MAVLIMAYYFPILLVLCNSGGSLGATIKRHQETFSALKAFGIKESPARAVPQSNWKQCVWKNLNGDKDNGKIKGCSFDKLRSDTALKVSFQGNMRVGGVYGKCNRWLFRFNGNECSGPTTIEAAVYNDWSPSVGNDYLLYHRSFEGYYENISQGVVEVELWVGPCSSGSALSDAFTGWDSLSRIFIEEVSRPQS